MLEMLIYKVFFCNGKVCYDIERAWFRELLKSLKVSTPMQNPCYKAL